MGGLGTSMVFSCIGRVYKILPHRFSLRAAAVLPRPLGSAEHTDTERAGACYRLARGLISCNKLRWSANTWCALEGKTTWVRFNLECFICLFCCMRLELTCCHACSERCSTAVHRRSTGCFETMRSWIGSERQPIKITVKRWVWQVLRMKCFCNPCTAHCLLSTPRLLRRGTPSFFLQQRSTFSPSTS